MRVNSIVESNNRLHKNLNNKYENRYRSNNGTDTLFCEILKQCILKRIEENNTVLINNNGK
ncbi:hypothetical protein [Clostridium sp. JS66]|uniref:hypothetical protein n=1 Tax=Clostridium sp. JS66 TaxID=3064705 RepID=UPI00298DE002|nr:hypothetical protein [Clostridium sp. JS66]WPC44106.1 hypothetical protein Q6H37_11700 [Clostridium sp. JS66]